MKNFRNKKTTRLANTSRILRLYSFVFLANLVLIVTITMTSSHASDSSSSSPENNVSTLEMKFFAHNYSTDSLDKRIERLEEFVFGTTKSGSEQERIKGLLDTVPDTPEDTTNNNQSTDETTNTDKPNLTSETASRGKPQDNKSSDEIDIDNSNRAPSESYPAVTALEQQILGKTNESSPIDKRLSKLETKAFGKPSQSNDLSQRVDLLQQYLANKGTQSDSNPATDEQPMKWGDHPLGITQQIGNMEKQVFGKIYSKEKITSRLHRLEKKVFPKQPPETFAPIAARVTRLQTAIQPQQPSTNYNTAQSSTNSQSSPPGTIEPFASTGAGSSAYQSSYGNPATDTFNNNTSTANTQPKRSLLGKIGQVVGGVGSMALRSSMGMGGYGYGYPSYGYGGYGGGYPAYGSGYGYSPYGMGMGGGYGVSPFSSPIGGAYW